MDVVNKMIKEYQEEIDRLQDKINYNLIVFGSCRIIKSINEDGTVSLTVEEPK